MCIVKNLIPLELMFIQLIIVIIIFQFDDDEQQVESQSFTTAGRKRLFSKELRCMMYGFGDDENPYTESVDILEDLVIDFITDMVCIYLYFLPFCLVYILF